MSHLWLTPNVPESSVKAADGCLAYCEWGLTLVKTSTGEVIQSEKGHNLVVIPGREFLMKLLLGLGGSAFLALCAGACSTGTGSPPYPNVNDTHLYYEHILNGTRKPLTRTAGGGLTGADVKDVTFVDNVGNTYYVQCTARGTYVGVSDLNVNQPFQEFGLNSSNVCPGTPSGVSGTLLNHYIAQNPYILTSDVTLIVDTILHI